MLAWVVRTCWRPARPATYSVRIYRGAARPDAHFGVRTRAQLELSQQAAEMVYVDMVKAEAEGSR